MSAHNYIESSPWGTVAITTTIITLWLKTRGNDCVALESPGKFDITTHNSRDDVRLLSAAHSGGWCHHHWQSVAGWWCFGGVVCCLVFVSNMIFNAICWISSPTVNRTRPSTMSRWFMRWRNAICVVLNCFGCTFFCHFHGNESMKQNINFKLYKKREEEKKIFTCKLTWLQATWK